MIKHPPIPYVWLLIPPYTSHCIGLTQIRRILHRTFTVAFNPA